MKDTPFLHLGLRVERSTYLKIKKLVKAENTTVSKFLRDIVNSELSKNLAKNFNISDSPIEQKSFTNNSIQ